MAYTFSIDRVISICYFLTFIFGHNNGKGGINANPNGGGGETNPDIETVNRPGTFHNMLKRENRQSGRCEFTQNLYKIRHSFVRPHHT